MAKSFSYRWLLKSLDGLVLTARQLESKVIKLFNSDLESFPPGVGPGDIIEEAIKRDLIKRVGNRYLVDL